MLVKTDAPCQREGNWQLMENNGKGSRRKGVSWESSALRCHVGGLPLFIAPSSHLVIQTFFLHIPTE